LATFKVVKKGVIFGLRVAAVIVQVTLNLAAVLNQEHISF
jgi:hypothetical protein